MNRYFAKFPYNDPNTPVFRPIGIADDEVARLFGDVISEQGLMKALEDFPRKWKWFDKRGDVESDMPAIIGSGMALSPRAFAEIKRAFPDDVTHEAEITIGGKKFVWMFPPLLERAQLDIESSSPNFWVDGDTFKKCFSSSFVDLWKVHGFQGVDFVDAGF